MASQEFVLESCQFFRCPVCFEIFNNPKVLSCGHSFCESPCLIRIAGVSAFLKCPECRVVTKVPDNDVKNLPTNFSLLRAINDEKSKNSTCTRHDQARNVKCYTCDADICKECIQDGHTLDTHDSDVSRALDITSTALFSVQEFRRMLQEKHVAVIDAETAALKKWQEVSLKIRQSADCAREEIDEIEGDMLMRLELETEDDRQTFAKEIKLFAEMMTQTVLLEEKTNSIAKAMREGDIDRLHERYQLESDVVSLYKDVFPAYDRPTPTRSKVLIYLQSGINLSFGDLKIAPRPPKRKPPPPPLIHHVTSSSSSASTNTSENKPELMSSHFAAASYAVEDNVIDVRVNESRLQYENVFIHHDG